MKNSIFFKLLCVVAIIVSTLYVNAQVPSGIVPATGIPVLVPATVSDLNTQNGYCQLSYGTSGLQRSITNCNPLTLAGHQAGNSGNSHVVITTTAYDSLSCADSISGQSLITIPDIPFWDSLNYGQLRVMKLGDEVAGSYPFASAASTYYFTPTEEQNLLFLWIAYLSEEAQHHNKSEIGFFRVEVTDTNGNYVSGNYYNSTFYIIPQTTFDPVLHPCCQAQYLIYHCPSNQTFPPKMWSDWKQLVFDLRSFIGQTVKLRIIVSECLYQAHYTYGYYTGFGVNGNLNVQSCSPDSTSIQAPVGFKNYKWYVNNVYIPTYDSLSVITMPRNTSDTLFRCDIISDYEDTIRFAKIVNYYSITPDFNWQQQVEGDLYKVQFTNNSTLLNNTDNGHILENIENLQWNFGDGSTSSELNPIHYYSGVGPYTVTLRVFDNYNLCSEAFNDEILLSGVSVNDASISEILFNAYPNPFNEEIILEVSNTNETVSFEIINILGQVIDHGVINKQAKIKTHHYYTGMYIIKFKCGNQTYFSKLVKE